MRKSVTKIRTVLGLTVAQTCQLLCTRTTTVVNLLEYGRSDDLEVNRKLIELDKLIDYLLDKPIDVDITRLKYVWHIERDDSPSFIQTLNAGGDLKEKFDEIQDMLVNRTILEKMRSPFQYNLEEYMRHATIGDD